MELAYVNHPGGMVVILIIKQCTQVKIAAFHTPLADTRSRSSHLIDYSLGSMWEGVAKGSHTLCFEL